MAIVQLVLNHNKASLNSIANSLTGMLEVERLSDSKIRVYDSEIDHSTAIIDLGEFLMTITVDDSLPLAFLGRLAEEIVNLDHVFLTTPTDQIGRVGTLLYARNYFEMSFESGPSGSDTGLRSVEMPALVQHDPEFDRWYAAEIGSVESFIKQERHPRYDIERVRYQEILTTYKRTPELRNNLRYGQYVHQQLKLERMSNTMLFDKLYQLDGREAVAFIEKHFNLT